MTDIVERLENYECGDICCGKNSMDAADEIKRLRELRELATNRYQELIIQNSELLTALEGTATWLDNYGYRERGDEVRAAIEKATR